MKIPRVSIGLPVYNGEKYLQHALDSLLQQDYEDFELIISDNASTDATAEICKMYEEKDKRVHYSRNDSNIGAAPNYAKVFELSRGKFFKWCAHDDACYPGFLSRCLTVMESAPPYVVLMYPRCEFIDEFGNVIPRSCDHLESRAKQPYRRLARVVRRVSHGGPMWGLIRADYLRRTRLMGSLSYGDDLLLAELSLYGEIWEIPEVLFQVRCYRGNAVAVCAGEQAAVVLRNPNKANRKTRKALLAWTDSSKASKRIWLPIHEEHCWEYMKRVYKVPLPIHEKLLCYLTIPAVYYWGCFRDYGGNWKLRLFHAVVRIDCHEDQTTEVLRLRAGEVVEVRNKQEILKTLDKDGRFDGMPFMPEMFAFCAKRFRVYKRAHKGCHNVFPNRSRRIRNAVHLETRCDGEAHGGCQATCLIYWKEAWLRRMEEDTVSEASRSTNSTCVEGRSVTGGQCTEEDVLRATQCVNDEHDSDATYVCQATRLPYGSDDLSPWDIRQYVEDYTSGNVGLAQWIRGITYIAYVNLVRLGIYLGLPLRWLYDGIQMLWGGLWYSPPRSRIRLGEEAPTTDLKLQEGELVRVKSYQNILASYKTDNKNREFPFDMEMMPFCGGTYRVKRQITKVVNEATGKMVEISNSCVMLENVVCEARYSKCRLFCPRSIYLHWRGGWLERIPERTHGASI
jgi:hypothetical protein